MLIRRVVDTVCLQKADQKTVVAPWCSHDIPFDTVLAGNLRRMALYCDFANLGSYGMLGDIAERTWHGLHELIQKSLHLIAPQWTAAFDPIILPVQLGFAIGFGQHL
ncbi:hypothetical protein D3C87_1588220 [compost metagenome]